MRIALLAFASASLLSALEAQHPTLAHGTSECRAAGRVSLVLNEPRSEAHTAVAVYPLAGGPSAGDGAYLIDAIPRAVADRLGAVRELDVAYFSHRIYSPNAIASPSFWPRSAAGKSYALVGRLSRERADTRVELALHGGTMNESLWSARYSLRATPWEQIVEQVALAVAANIGQTASEGMLQLSQPMPTGRGRELVHRARYAMEGSIPGAAAAVPLYLAALGRDSADLDALTGVVAALARTGAANSRLPGISRDSAVAIARRSSARAIRIAPGDARSWIARGQALALEDPFRYAGVIQAYQRAISRDPASSEARLQLALAQSDLRQDAASNREFRRALEAAPWRVDIMVAFARTLLLQRNFDAACVLLNHAVSTDPDHGPAYAERGLVRVRLGEMREAIADGETAARTGDVIGGTLASLVARAASRDTVAAITDLNRLRALVGSIPDGEAAVLLALAHASVGRRDEALSLLSSVAPHTLARASLLRHYGFDPVRRDRRFSAGAPAVLPSRPIER